MEPYRLLFVIARYFEFGGLQRDMLRMAKHCAALGHEVTVLTGRWDGLKPNGITVKEADIRAASNHRSTDKLANQLRHLTTAETFDCVVGFNKVPGLDIYYAGDPCFAGKLDETKPRIVRWLPRYRAMLRQEADVLAPEADTQIILIAHREREKFIQHYGTLPDHFTLLPPGIDRTRFERLQPTVSARQSLRRKLNIQNDEVMVLAVGSAFRTKGVDRTIRAVAALPNSLRSRSRLVVVGKDDPKPFTRIVKTLGIDDRVTFTGPRNDVAALYHTADLLIHPARSENTGTVLLEAMLCVLPVLVTGNCGFAFHVQEAGAGIVLPQPFDQAALNDALKAMIKSKEQARFGADGKAYCDKTDLYSLIEQAADLIVTRAQRNQQRK